MSVVRTNYYVLISIIVLPIFLFVFGQKSEILYSIISLLIFIAFLYVSYRIQTELKKPRSKSVGSHLKRQTNIIMMLIVTGIVSSLYSILSYHIDSNIISAMTGFLAGLIYLWGIWSLLTGMNNLPPRNET